MRLALNGATIMHSPLADDIEIAAEAGYSAVEIWAGKLDAYLRDRSLEELAARMLALGVQPWCINSIEDITPRDALGRVRIIEQLERMSSVAMAVGAPSIVVVPGRAPAGLRRAGAVADAVQVLRMMSDVAGEVGLAFEFLGKPGCSVPTLDMAIEIVDQVDRTNVGMVIDTFHFHAGGSVMSDLRHVPVDKLFVVHLNGCEDHPRDELTDAHRLFPGEGVIPIDEILRALRSLGFDGTMSIEIFRPEYWERDARDVALEARTKAVGVLAKAGYSLDSAQVVVSS